MKFVKTVRSSPNKFYKLNKSVHDIAGGHAPWCMPAYLANHMNAYRTELLGPEPGDPPAFSIDS